MAPKKTGSSAEGSKAAKSAPAKKAASGAKAAPAKAGKSMAAESAAAATPVAKAAPTHEEIARRAHQYWKERGGHHGSHAADWARAEKDLTGE